MGRKRVSKFPASWFPVSVPVLKQVPKTSSSESSKESFIISKLSGLVYPEKRIPQDRKDKYGREEVFPL